MLIFLNGQFVPEEQAVVSVLDRGFLYGDGLFETFLVAGGQPFCWEQHVERLQRGADLLKLRLPFASAELRRFAGQLIAKNQMPESFLRLTLSRGVGPRGYSPKGANAPTLAMSLHPAPKIDMENPPRWRVVTSSMRLMPGDQLAALKHCNKLPQILARAEADAAGADEALLLTPGGEVVEATSSNLFWIERGAVQTPPLASGILPGVTRAVVFEICAGLGLSVDEAAIASGNLRRMEGVFLSVSTFGIVEALSLDGHALRGSPLVAEIRAAYWELVRTEGRAARHESE